jgi:hypothetical protein
VVAKGFAIGGDGNQLIGAMIPMDGLPDATGKVLDELPAHR